MRIQDSFNSGFEEVEERIGKLEDISIKLSSVRRRREKE